MEENFKGNHELEPLDIFAVFNNYLLLFFGFSCILSNVFVQQLFVMMGETRAGTVVGPVLGVVVPAYLVTHRFPGGFRKQLLIRRPQALLAAQVLIATLLVAVIVDYIYVMSEKFTTAPVEYIDGLKELKPSGAPAIALTFLGLCVLVPLAEEIVFRGLIQRVFTRNMGGVLAMVLAGAFFGVIHLQPQMLLSMIAFGIFLGYLFFATSNLTYPILAHCAFNTISWVQLVTLPVEKLDSVPPYTQSPWVLLAALAATAYLLVRIKKGGSVSAKPPRDVSGGSDAR
jgi:membrane protease YdiL (CAAX protease family)